MSGKGFRFDHVDVDKKKIYACMQPIGIHSVESNRMLISDKFKHSDKGVKYFIGYAGNDVIRAV